MGFIATVTSKGQMTLPAKLRAALGVEAGDRIEFTIDAQGDVRLRKLSRTFDDLRGMVTIEGSAAKIDEWIDRARGRAASGGSR